MPCGVLLQNFILGGFVLLRVRRSLPAPFSPCSTSRWKPPLFFGHGRHTATIAIAEIPTTPKLAVAVFTPPLVFTVLGVCRTKYVCQEVLSK